MAICGDVFSHERLVPAQSRECLGGGCNLAQLPTPDNHHGIALAWHSFEHTNTHTHTHHSIVCTISTALLDTIVSRFTTDVVMHSAFRTPHSAFRTPHLIKCSCHVLIFSSVSAKIPKYKNNLVPDDEPGTLLRR